MRPIGKVIERRGFRPRLAPLPGQLSHLGDGVSGGIQSWERPCWARSQPTARPMLAEQAAERAMPAMALGTAWRGYQNFMLLKNPPILLPTFCMPFHIPAPKFFTN